MVKQKRKAKLAEMEKAKQREEVPHVEAEALEETPLPDQPKGEEIGLILAKRSAVKRLLKKGVSLTNIFTRSEDVRLSDAEAVLTEDFVREISKDNKDFQKICARWKKKYLD